MELKTLAVIVGIPSSEASSRRGRLGWYDDAGAGQARELLKLPRLQVG